MVEIHVIFLVEKVLVIFNIELLVDASRHFGRIRSAVSDFSHPLQTAYMIGFMSSFREGI